jgi:alanyl-tRNA synthetase
MTDRLYYADPYLQSFDARIAGVRRDDAGRLVVTLDRTAFYPTSGGQPFDTGTLDGCRVLDVNDEEDGSVGHLVEGDCRLDVGQLVHGRIDWTRRFDHMQQHTGQHVLSSAIDRLLRVRTVSFHLGASAATIDLARDLSIAELTAAETEANRIVWEDRPVSIRYASAEEAARLPLRKESVREGTLRLIDVQEFDLSACGGTHVARTGAIGVIAVSSWERFKGGQRLEFLCGGRALARFHALRDQSAATVRLLSVLPEDIPATVERLQGEIKDQKRSLVTLQMDLARFLAVELQSKAEIIPAGRLVLHARTADAVALKALAVAVAAQPGLIAVLASDTKPTLVVVAKAPDVKISVQEVLTALTARFGGRGGGKGDLAQGGGLDGSPDEIFQAVRAIIAQDSRM